MSDSFSKFTMQGVVESNSGVRTLPSGRKVTRVILSSSRLLNTVSDNKEDCTIPVDFFGAMALTGASISRKGLIIRVSGRIRSYDWEGKQITGFVVESFAFGDSLK